MLPTPQTQKRNKVIVIGAGLSGLSAARQLLTTSPDIELTVLEAMGRVGGRTSTININGYNFDQGGAFIGQTQIYALNLAIQSGNKLLNIFNNGTKIAELNRKFYHFQSEFPGNLNIWIYLQTKLLVWRLNRMAKTVSTLDPKACENGYQWDSMSVQSWLNRNVFNKQLKVMIEVSLRSVLGGELMEVSFLYLLWFIHQNRSFQNIVRVDFGLQEFKTKLGAQHMSEYLAKEIISTKGRVILNVFVKKIEQHQNRCFVTCTDNRVYQSDYLIMACSPWQANKIDFFPMLSTDRKLLCQRSIMGSYIKVIILYKKAYWRLKGLSGEMFTDCLESPAMWVMDDTAQNQKGETQPALVVFAGGFSYRLWKNRNQIQKSLIGKLAQAMNEPEMLDPIRVHWKAWEDEPSIGGGPTGFFGPGVLSQVDDLRRSQGRIHWAGTELATVSTGYMDGAIESGIRAAQEVAKRVKGSEKRPKTSSSREQGPFWYTKFTRTTRKWFEWF